MNDNLVIECIWYKSKRDFNKFIKTIEDPSVHIIDYLLIKNKLIKADPYNEEPQDSVIGDYIISTIKSILDLEYKQPPNTIVYSFKNLDLETVANFKELINQYTDREHTTILNVLNMDRVPNKKILNKFDFVKFVDHDQA